MPFVLKPMILKINHSLTTLILACLTALALPPAAIAQNQRGDDAINEMAQAFKRSDKARLTAMLPQVRGHVLEPQAAYWELKARLEEASALDVQDMMARYAGSYHEDRLRNDWLLLLGKRRDWSSFAAEYPKYRMNDDKEVRCYALLVESVQTGSTSKEMIDEVRRNWYGIRDADDGCTQAADRFYADKKLSALDVWREARISMEGNRARAATNAVQIVSPDASTLVSEINASPLKFLNSRATATGKERKELVTLALIKLATSDADSAAAALENKWSPILSAEERSWAWGVIGKQAALKLSDLANSYYANARNEHLNDDLLGWKVRTALRSGDAGRSWPVVLAAVNAMSDEGRKDSTFVYWKARALDAIVAKGADGRGEIAKAAAQTAAHMAAAARGDAATTLVLDNPQLAEARKLLEGIASLRGFYEMLALEELGQRIMAPPRPASVTAQEKEGARLNAGLNRALYAITIGLRSEGVREWNYSTNLHTKGGMAERELLAAADFACERQVWDRCINTSERTKEGIDTDQRFPMPFKDNVVRRSKEIGLDPAYVYGLIRQESRFIMDARSSVGASGLMQVMPATARWTAKKIGMDGFTVAQLNDQSTNIAIGTAYLKLALDDFAGSMPLAAAAYNAGPNRPRAWRNGPQLEAAAWAENVPFAETRDYVKKVLANTTMYAAILTGQPQSLKARLGSVGPREGSAPEVNKDLP
jgi:soluble lytic murein transglycosylase